MNYMVNIPISLGLLFLTLLSAYLWGRMLFFRFIDNSWSRGEKIFLGVGMGLGVISYLIFFLSLTGLLYRPVIFVILLIPFLWFAVHGRNRSADRAEPLSIASSIRSLSLIERVSFLILPAIFLGFPDPFW